MEARAMVDKLMGYVDVWSCMFMSMGFLGVRVARIIISMANRKRGVLDQIATVHRSPFFGLLVSPGANQPHNTKMLAVGTRDGRAGLPVPLSSELSPRLFSALTVTRPYSLERTSD